MFVFGHKLNNSFLLMLVNQSQSIYYPPDDAFSDLVHMLVNHFQSIYYPSDDAFSDIVVTYAHNYFHVLVKLLHCC